MLKLQENPTIRNFQDYVKQLEMDRGFDEQTAIEKCLLLGEEIGELFKAVRKCSGLGIDNSSNIGSVAEEIADIVIYLCSIANRFNINIENAFRDKEEINKKRKWE